MFTILRQDLSQGARMLARNPGFTLLATFTLGLGIAVNSAMFSVVHAVLLRPLPFTDADRVAVVYETRQGSGKEPVSGYEYAAWRERSTAFSQMALYGYARFNLTGAGDAEMLAAVTGSADLFTVLGTRPLLGRVFVEGDDRGGPRIVLLSHALWQRRFGGETDVVGRSILLDDEPYTVIGVMPSHGEFDPDVWVPLDVPAEVVRVGHHSTYAVGRLRPGVRMEDAQAELVAISRQLETEFAEFGTGHSALVQPLFDDVVEGARLPVLILLGAVAFVLLIACANVAHLLLTRVNAREREIAIRSSLGATRGRLVSLLLTESLVLALLGGTVGVLLAAWIIDLLPSIRAVEIPRLTEVRLSPVVLIATAGLIIVTGLISGMLPALRGTRLHLATWLADGSRGSRSTATRISGVLMVTQLALALVLLVGAGLMGRSLLRLLDVDPGFESDGVIALDIALPAARYPGPQHQLNGFDGILERIRQLPGITDVGATTQLPLAMCCDNYPITVEGAPPPPPADVPTAVLSVVTPDYFRTMQMRVLHGRTFTDADARIALPLIRYWEQQPSPPNFAESQPEPVVVINNAMAQRHWPGQDPVGRRIRLLFSPWVTVVGVINDVRQSALSADVQPIVYLVNAQEPSRAMTVVARATIDPAGIAPLIAEQVRGFDANIPVGRMQPLTRVYSDAMGRPRFYAAMFIAFGGLALLLSVVGTYGVISWAVAQRRREIGIRSALGADTADLLRLVLGRAALLTLLGIAIGVIVALGLTRLMTGLLFGIEPADPLTFAGIATVLAGVSLTASYIPMRRAARIDPMEVVRAE